MFGTLRYGRQGGDAKFVDQTGVFLARDPASLHSACDSCRVRKVCRVPLITDLFHEKV